MISYDSLLSEVKAVLSEKRLKHSLGVQKRAIEYAQIYGADTEVVKLVALAHDIAKEIPENMILSVAEQMNIQLDEIEKRNLNLVHSKIGATICRQQFQFTEDMCNAIAYHTTGREKMSLLEKIIFLADATEENRNYSDLEWYVNLIKKDIDKGVMEVTRWTLEELLHKQKVIHINTLKCYNDYNKMESDV